MKNYKKHAILLCCGVVSILSVHPAVADGYRNPPPTAEGIAKSGVNSVFVDDASAISYNPANLALQTNQSLVVSLTMARTENTYTPPGSPVSYESSGDWNYLPNIYYSLPVGDKGLAFGLGITTPFGQGLAWERSDFAPAAYPSGTIPYEASVALININPTVAFKVHENVSVGIGLDIYYSQFEMTAVNVVTFPIPVPPGSFTTDPFDSEASGDGWGFGANAGVSWDVTEAQRLAITYRSAFEIDYSGDFKVEGMSDADFETTIKYPNMISLGYGIQLSEKVQLETMVEWLQWSSNDEQILTIEGQPPITMENNWDDTFTIGLGGSWQALDALAVRAGYAYIPSPIPDDTITYMLPDADRHAISFGLGYTLGAHTLDLAYTFSIYEERSDTTTGTYDIDSNLVGLSYSASF